MPKQPYFQFKQFKVWHDRCGLKVTTEACLLGALADVEKARKVLDIGTGSGLLALMLAQRNASAQITAVEIFEDAYNQAVDNFKQSPFSDRIVAHLGAIQAFSEQNDDKFDLIISNPPFFENHLLPQNQKKLIALHNQTLSFEDLAKSVSKLLHDNGIFVVIFPPHSTQMFIKEAAKVGLFCQKQISIRQFDERPVFRYISTFSRKVSNEILEEEIVIYQSQNVYTEDFTKLMEPFYASL